MSTRVVDQVDSWDDRSFSGGYRELQDLADGEFSGVVRAGGAELYMTRGVVIGIRRGDIEDFESGGTIYEAPTDALPLLAIMQERSDEVRAKYYTEDTSISKVDKTLSDGGFTGFIELSENVLSGDYYLVYHAGTSMSVAYVGESSRLIEGDEAFETADGEVGIYEVRPVDIDPIEIPEPEDGGSEGGDTAGADSAGTADRSTDTTDDSKATGTDEPEPEPATDEPDPSPSEDAGELSEASAPTAQSSPDGSTAGDGAANAQAEPAAEQTTEPTTEARSEERERTTTEGSATGESDPEPREPEQSTANKTTERTQQTAESDGQPARQRRSGSESREQATRGGAGGTGAGQAGRTRSERQSTERRGRPQSPQEPARSEPRAQPTGQSQRADAGADGETKAIPSLDPDQTAVPDDGSDDPIPSPAPNGQSQPPQTEPAAEPAAETVPAGEPNPEQAAESPPPEPEPSQSREPAGVPSQTEPAPDPAAAPAVDTERVEELETELAEKDEEIDQLESELEAKDEERDGLETELEELRAERDELQTEVEELQSELRRLEEELGAATDAERRLTAEEALAGTDIFVRYRSKGKATLEKAHGASTRKDEVNENLRLEKHTQFDAASVAVGGQSYDEFLESTLEYQFVRWAVRELLFEIRDTGHAKALGDLYDVLPQVDRAELSGVVEVTYTEDGQETQSQEGFDVVLRDRMGNPLLAANLNDSREATTESMMERLITSAERVGQSAEGFSGAFLVTESFFDPGALEIASDATQGGLLSRDKRKSFVNLSRKRGYHLCLVEARNENFHLAVPEL